MKELNNYRNFNSIQDSREFGKRLNGDWLSDFHVGGRFHRMWLYDFGYYKKSPYAYEVEWGNDFENKYIECEISEVFRLYCGFAHKEINIFCRDGLLDWSRKYKRYKIYNEYDHLRISKTVSIMCGEILKFKLDESIITYRTLSYGDLLHSVDLKKMKKGDIVTHKGFLSTGLVLDSLLKVHGEYDTILKLYVPAGCNALYLDFISNREDEQELLFLPDTKLEIVSNNSFGWFSKRKRLIVCKLISKIIEDT